MNLKYTFGAIAALPLLPFMYLDGKRIRSSVPKLPEAREPEGLVEKHSDEKLNVLILGESTVAGVGVATHSEGFAGTFASELANQLETTVSWRVYARSGYTARQVRKRLLPKITEEQADLIVIGLGGNDAFTLNTPKRWKQDSAKLIDELRALFPDTPIAFTNMPPIKEFPAFTGLIKFTIGNLVEILGEELKRLVASREQVFYYDDIITIQGWSERLQLNNAPTDFFSDGVHPSKLTYQAWAKDFCFFLLNKASLEFS
ncbi:MAG: SGNH/GDSL hydrolase family protein [Flavobacteriaceae bacterium]|nr:SGNH/GDSL hydrolase family protein [Flavobacteriaceae bacterium]